MMVTVLAPLLLAQTNNAPKDEGSTLLLWSVALIGLAAILFLIEIFLPSGGLIGIGAALSMVAGIVLLFWHNQTWGLIGAILTLLALPFLLGFALKIWPDTPIGRVLMLNAPASRAAPAPEEGEQAGSHAANDSGSAASGAEPGSGGGGGVAVGQQGRAITEMRPVGTCVFEGRRREECLATGGLIDSDTPVEVVAIDGRQIKVRPVSS